MEVLAGVQRISCLGRPKNFAHALGRPLAHEAEHVAGDPANLDLVRPFGDPVAAVVAVDVLEGLVPRIAQASVHLHGLVGRVATETVGLVNVQRYSTTSKPGASRGTRKAVMPLPSPA